MVVIEAESFGVRANVTFFSVLHDVVVFISADAIPVFDPRFCSAVASSIIESFTTFTLAAQSIGPTTAAGIF